MSTSSAVPDDLERFGSNQRHAAESLLIVAGELASARAWFTQTCEPDPMAGSFHVDAAEELLGVARRLLALADDTSSIASAFRRADAACHLGSPLLQVDDRDLTRAARRIDPVAGLFVDLRRAGVARRRTILEGLERPTVAELVRRHPTWVGNSDGVPWRLRVEANHRLVAAALRRADHDHDAGLVTFLRRLQHAHVLLFDPVSDRVAVVHGDLDTARNVGVFVPGMGSTFVGFLDGTDKNGRAILDAAERREPGRSAIISWLGYRPPPGVDGLDPGPVQAAIAADAEDGGDSLVTFVDGLCVRPEQHLVVFGHSYGTVAIGEALKRGLRCDDVVVAGSPGIGFSRASQLDGQVFGMVAVLAAPGDPVAHLGAFGTEPDRPSFGAARLATNAPGRATRPGHANYFLAGSESLSNLAAVLLGRPATLQAPSTTDRLVDLADLTAAGAFAPAKALHTASEHRTGPGATPLRAADEVSRIGEAAPGWAIRSGTGLVERVTGND